MYQIEEHIMYKNIGICVVEEIGKPGFSRIKKKNIIRCVRWMRRATHGFMFLSILISLCGISLQKKKPVLI